ncbi:MAG: NAD(P)-dependent glycerol-3-phosphate dehydrogenase [Bacilli bacterium]|nr:NAD(P)-dependent glycerol-3-phosphate dehydrogenase [Bacilli bacterium]
MLNKVCVLGSGAWGTALADILANNGYETVIYGIIPEEIEEINKSHSNSKYYPNGYFVNKSIKATLDINEALKDSFLIVLAVPSFALVDTVSKIKDQIDESVIIVNVAKGFDNKTHNTFSTVIKSALGNRKNPIIALVGPTFAEEVVEHQFTAITAFSENLDAATVVQKAFSNSYFRVYVNDDIIGAEYCSALKNVIALASGILDGLGCKVNTRAALIARGLLEISRYVTFFGGNLTTCYGLAGIGDLTLTCSSTTSRNYSAGYTIGSKSIEYFKANNTKTVEGVYACEIAYNIAKANNIYSPIVESVYNIIFNGINPKDEIRKLMSNELKHE